MITFLGYDITIGLANSVVTVPGRVEIDGDLTVSGDLVCESTVEFASNLKVDGDCLLNEDVDIGGNVIVDGALTVDNPCTLKGDVTIGTTVFDKLLYVYGDITCTDTLSCNNLASTSSLSTPGNITSTGGISRGVSLRSDSVVTLGYTSLPSFVSTVIGYNLKLNLSSNVTVTSTSSYTNIMTTSSLAVGAYVLIGACYLRQITGTGQIRIRQSSNNDSRFNLDTGISNFSTMPLCCVVNVSTAGALYVEGIVTSGTMSVVGVNATLGNTTFIDIIRIA